MINESIKNIVPNRLQLNIISGHIKEHEKDFGGILGDVNDLSSKIDRSNYLIKYLDVVNNLKDVDERVKVINDNEIGELAQSFNIMAQSIEESDIIRKEFISNVSHELRSPITSIKGFIGGILDGVIPKDKENESGLQLFYYLFSSTGRVIIIPNITNAMKNIPITTTVAMSIFLTINYYL